MVKFHLNPSGLLRYKGELFAFYPSKMILASYFGYERFLKTDIYIFTFVTLFTVNKYIYIYTFML